MRKYIYIITMVTCILFLNGCSVTDVYENNKLNPLERVADKKLNQIRANLFKRLDTAILFKQFQKSLPQLRKDSIYRVFYRMPKGGLLHTHGGAILDNEKALELASEHNEFCLYVGNDALLPYGTLLSIAEGESLPQGVVRLKEFEKNNSNWKELLLDLYTLDSNDKASGLWTEFEDIFLRTEVLNYSAPIFKELLVNAFTKMANEGVQFLELRTSLDGLYDENMNFLSKDSLMRSYADALRQVKVRYPSFDLKFVYCGGKYNTNEELEYCLRQLDTLSETYSKSIVGVDLIGEEDSLNPLSYYESVLSGYHKYPLMLHAGESASSKNTNIETAVRLGSVRLGHALNLYFFPSLEEEVKAKHIAIECCPISNQVLGYVDNMSQHPANKYIKDGQILSINSDDNAIFGTSYITDDFLAAYLSWNLDLSSIKQLILNSILYSGLTSKEKSEQLQVFEENWEIFIRTLAK